MVDLLFSKINLFKSKINSRLFCMCRFVPHAIFTTPFEFSNSKYSLLIYFISSLSKQKTSLLFSYKCSFHGSLSLHSWFPARFTRYLQKKLIFVYHIPGSLKTSIVIWEWSKTLGYIWLQNFRFSRSIIFYSWKFSFFPYVSSSVCFQLRNSN